MYQLWGGGSPFKTNSDNTLTDRAGSRVHLLGDVPRIWHELATSSKWSDTVLCVASRCDEPRWAVECLSKFKVSDDGMTMMDCIKNDTLCVIHKGSKKSHFREIHTATGVPYDQML